MARTQSKNQLISVLIPALSNKDSLGTVIKAAASADYPVSEYEIIIICSEHDYDAISIAAEAIIEGKIANARVVLHKKSGFNRASFIRTGRSYAKSKLELIVLPSENPSPGYLKQFIDNASVGIFGGLRSLLSKKIVQFGLIGGGVFGFGMALLYVFVEFLGWSPLTANAVQLAVTFYLNYILNRNITWRERTVSRLASIKFLVSRGVTTLLNYGLFAALISLQFSFAILGTALDFTINYLVANVISLAVVMLINYVVSDQWAFAEIAKSKKSNSPKGRIPFSIYASVLMVAIISFGLGFNPVLTVSVLLAIASLVLLSQSSMEVWRTIYSYREPGSVDRLRFPRQNGIKEKFCIIVPARHEADVLADTLRQLAKQTHPNTSIVTVICSDDTATLKVARRVEKKESRIRVIEYPLLTGVKPSKPKQLNYVFNIIKREDFSIVGVIDAEDTVHPELLMHVDAAFRDRKTGVVQGGVQLINYDSSWYSMHNVLEYYRWFNSSMAFQSDNQFMPLGGNTVFVRLSLLKRAGGWPDTLTEDCSLGVLLSAKFQTKTAVYYEPILATREETPDTLSGLFKQRVRWNQGFFHEWRKGVWRRLPSFRQRLLADYVLLGPVLLAVISLFVPVSLLAIAFLDAPVALVILMYLPLIPVSLLMIFNAVFLHDFGTDFKQKIRLRHYGLLLLTQIPYQLVLNAAALWAVIRELRGDNTWYKTPHAGKHRLGNSYGALDAAKASFAKGAADA